MKVVTVELHHEVLTAWAEYRRTLDCAPVVWSVDFHTDVLDASRREPAVSLCRDAVQAVKLLHHDEHFDWALRAGIVSQAVIGALSPCAFSPAHPALTVRRHRELPDLDAMLNGAAQFRTTASQVLSDSFLTAVFGETLPPPGFILDIDCDYIMCEAALHPAENAYWHTLIRRAGLVTLSCENDWVKILRLPGEKISGTAVAAELEKQIHAIVAADI